MCFSPQRRAMFQHLNFKKWSETVSFFPKQFTVGFTLKKKKRCAQACARLLSWAWLGRGVGVAWACVAWAWCGRGLGVAWAWRGRGLGVAWAWLGRGVGVAWAWRGRGVGVAWAWAKDLVMLLWGSMGCFSGAVAHVLWGQRHWLPPPPTTKTISPGVIPNSVLEFHSGTPWMKRFCKKFTGLSTIYVSLFKRKEPINVWSCHRPAMKIQQLSSLGNYLAVSAKSRAHKRWSCSLFLQHPKPA